MGSRKALFWSLLEGPSQDPYRKRGRIGHILEQGFQELLRSLLGQLDLGPILGLFWSPFWPCRSPFPTGFKYVQ